MRSSVQQRERAAQALRQRAVASVLSGKTQIEVARLHGVSLRAVAKWMALHRMGGVSALKPARRGRRVPDTPPESIRERALDRLAFYEPKEVGLGAGQWTPKRLTELIFALSQTRMAPSPTRRWLFPPHPAKDPLSLPEQVTRLRMQRQSELFALIYDGPLSVVPWSGFMDRLRHLMEANWVTLIVTPSTPKQPALLLNSGAGGTTVLDNPYATYEVLSLDPFFDLPTDRVVGIEDVVDEVAWLASDFYKQFVAVHNVRYQVGADLRTEDGLECRLRIARPPESRPFSAADRVLCNSLLPHLRRSLLLYARMERMASEQQAYSGAIDQLLIGTLVLDEQRRVLSCNMAAQELLAADDGVSLDSGLIVLRRPSEQRDFERLLDAAVSGRTTSATAGGSGAMSVSRPSGRDKLGLAVRSLPRRPWADGTGRPAVAVYLGDPERRPESSRFMLQRLYGLSVAEASLAMCLAEGLTLESSARRLAISKHTARSQLRTIFGKTGVSRQSSLLRLILSNTVSLA